MVRAVAAAGRLRNDRRGNISLLTGAAAPVIIMLAGMGIEVNHWAAVKVELQRAADLAALAGATDYASNANAQSATNTAANLAELNGGTGGTTRIWSASNRLLTDNQITAQVAPGVRDSNQTGVAVTVTQTVPLAFTKLLSTLPSITITAEGWAEAPAFVQACLLALNANGQGLTTSGNVGLGLQSCSAISNASITASGNTTMSASDFFADGPITASGNATMSASNFFANGSITTSGNARINGTFGTNSSTTADPYASDSAIQGAFANLKSGQGATFPSHGSASPGTYSSLNISGNNTVTLNPGLYYVNGNVSLSGNGSLTGSGVTIIASGHISVSGNFKLSLTAATPSSGTGAIPGVVLAGTSSSASSISGNTAATLNGVVYYPNGQLTFSGNASDKTGGCLEVIAGSVIASGNSSLVGNCQSYGALAFGHGSSAVALVR